MTNSLADNLYGLGTTMATNLVEMGVTDADPDDGLTTLAGKILDIEPSISGLDLDTAVTLTASSASIVVGGSVVLTSKLTASYDDETLVNVDLSGVLTSATILFKEGNTQIGSGVTDSTGTATATISGLTVGSHTIKAVFAGTENFDDCESTTVTVVVSNPAPDSMTLVKSAGKQILSYADVSGGDEYCTVKATVYDANDNPLAGETVTFSIGGTTVKSDVTDSNGEITYTYNSQGSGDVTITAECSLVSETYIVQDCLYYADSTKISNWNNVSAGSTQFKKSTYTIGLDSYSVEMKFNTINAQIMVGNESSWVAGVSMTDKNLYTHTSTGGTDTTALSSPVASDIWRMEVESTTIRLYRNDNLYTTKTNRKVDYPKNLRLHPQGNSASIDYLKVKPL